MKGGVEREVEGGGREGGGGGEVGREEEGKKVKEEKWKPWSCADSWCSWNSLLKNCYNSIVNTHAHTHAHARTRTHQLTL